MLELKQIYMPKKMDSNVNNKLVLCLLTLMLTSQCSKILKDINKVLDKNSEDEKQASLPVNNVSESICEEINLNLNPNNTVCIENK